MLELNLRYGGSTVTSSVRDSHFEFFETFPTKMSNLYSGNFNLAVGFTAYDGNFEPIDDPQYGQLKARMAGWTTNGWYRIPITLEKCTEQ